ncbi:MAG: hypothetical protein CSB24_01835 [Deltaproteobacteria bacterium]|nr:MAG: hypothetical protein CSB24_01835 [Deltaproteobacteria bacterium]
MKSSIFYSEHHKIIENKVKDLLNNHDDFLSPQTVQSPRAAGDAIEEIIADSFDTILNEKCADYQADFARRAMADLAFKDYDDFYYVVDVKTHRLETKFNMPNLTSVQRLARLYEDDRNYFSLLIIKYSLQKTSVKISRVHFVPIEFIGWDCLTVGALGWGQIQISNSNNITINDGYSRKKWMLELCDVLAEFYPKEISKISERVDYFEKVRQFWQKKEEN